MLSEPGTIAGVWMVLAVWILILGTGFRALATRRRRKARLVVFLLALLLGCLAVRAVLARKWAGGEPWGVIVSSIPPYPDQPVRGPSARGVSVLELVGRQHQLTRASPRHNHPAPQQGRSSVQATPSLLNPPSPFQHCCGQAGPRTGVASSGAC